MKQRTSWLLAGAVFLSLCCCMPASPAVAQPTPAASPSPSLTPAASAASIVISAPVPTDGPTPVPTPTATPAPTPTPEPTAQPRTCAEIVEEMAFYYARYGAEAEEKVAALLGEMAAAYPEEGEKWGRIMDRWRTLDQRVTVEQDVLPDGLPDGRELCIVALGYQLNANGTMKDQLKDRLRVVQRSAQKYPNAWVVCTGGGTASRRKNYTEAGQMSAWLKKHGVGKDRILTEKKSRTTVQNACFTLDMLLRDHPEVRYIALVSGDYHIRAATLFFEAAAILRTGPGEEPRFTVIANAACGTDHPEQSAFYRAGGLVELAGNEKTASRLYHDRYDKNKWPPLS